MDWDIFIPPKDLRNIALLNEILEKDLDQLLIPLGDKGENFIQTYQTQWGVLQFHLGVPGVPCFEEAEKTAVICLSEKGTAIRCISGILLLAAKEKADRPQDQADILFLRELRQAGKLV
jgi:hypothetical protein